MFSADLSWTEPNVEKVGERRERKARERSSTGSIKTASSSRSSVSADRELWWTSGLKKAKGLQSSVLRPSSHRSTNSHKTTRSPPKELELQLPDGLKDPTRQPSWTYATTLSPTLPSGATFDLPVDEVPELEGDSSSRRTTSTSTDIRLSRDQVTSIDIDLIAVAEEPQWEEQPDLSLDTLHTTKPYEKTISTPPTNGPRIDATSIAIRPHVSHSTPNPNERGQHERQEAVPQ